MLWRVFAAAVLGAVHVVLGAVAGGESPVQAKTPGETHCFKEICHRVKTISETLWWVGKTKKVIATYYDHPSVDRFNTGKYTSSGEIFNADDPTRASSSNFPDGTELLVWNPENGRALHVRINDFGPFHSDRKLDLTRAAAVRLGIVGKGVAELHVTVVAPPPQGEPRYKRARRYPPALGYLGVLGSHQIDALAERLVRNRSPDRTASVDIQRFLWSSQSDDPSVQRSAARFSLPAAHQVLEAEGSLQLAAFKGPSSHPALTKSPVIANVPRAPLPVAPQPRLHPASRTDARVLSPTQRSTDPIGDSPGRFALRLQTAERSGWRAPPIVPPSFSARRMRDAQPIRIATLVGANSVLPADRAYQVAAADVHSIRWSLPGLDTFMRVMAPVWGARVTPTQALQAAVAMAIMLLMATWATLRRLVSEHRRAPRLPAASPGITGKTPPLALPSVDPTPEAFLLRARPPASRIARGMRLEGLVTSKGKLEVAGEVRGPCRCNTLIVEAGGRVEGAVEAERVEIRGSFTGSIRATALKIEDSAQLEGDIALSIDAASPEPASQPSPRPHPRRLYLAAE